MLTRIRDTMKRQRNGNASRWLPWHTPMEVGMSEIKSTRMGPKPRPIEDRFWEKVAIGKGGACWLWAASLSAGGYGNLRVGGTQIGAHRISWEIHHGPIPDGMYVCHHCDTPACVNPEHLFLGTPKENSRDRDMKGRRTPPVGEAHGCAKLTASDVVRLRDMYSGGGVLQREVAEVFGISQSRVSAIVRGRSWSHPRAAARKARRAAGEGTA